MQAQTRERDAQVAAPRAAHRAALATLAVAAVALAAGIVVVLSHAAVRRSGTDDVTIAAVLRSLHGSHRICQDGERIPAGTAALRVSILPESEPHASMALDVASEGGAPVATAGSYRWEGDAAVFALRRPVARERAGRVCVQVRTHRRGGAVGLYGNPGAAPSATSDGSAIRARVRIDDLRAGRASWWALAPTIATRIGRTRPWLGSAAPLVAALLVLGSISTAAWLLVRTS